MTENTTGHRADSAFGHRCRARTVGFLVLVPADEPLRCDRLGRLAGHEPRGARRVRRGAATRR
ncbi:hypothetical protein AB0H00_21215 [Nocardia sp. NPDC023852]|uniref:hypothetical protein n=1 Tax=Nocardia sp. NPDC023852 TaxID=3154697 RepID=UPI00340971A9